MRVPAIRGLIRRRILANYRADPEVVQSLLPTGMKPKCHKGSAIVGICLIRLEKIRPKAAPFLPSISSENAAHRFAVELPGGEAVYIPRRDTSSWLNSLIGGRLFSGEHHFASFTVQDDNGEIELTMASSDGEASIQVKAEESDDWPSDSCFSNLEAASAFFEGGSRGYSDNHRQQCLDCLDLKIDEWRATPLRVQEIRSHYFENPAIFPPGSVQFDHALLMRDIPHEWHSGPSLPKA